MTVGQFGEPGIYRNSGTSEFYTFVSTGGASQQVTANTAGTLRPVRSGNLLQGFFLQNGAWVGVGSGQSGTGPTRINLDIGGITTPGGIKIAFDNFVVNSGMIALPSLIADKPSLSFTYQEGFVGPIMPQSLTISSSGTAINVTASATTNPPGGSWLLVGPTDGITPTILNVNVAGGLKAGTYNGQITLSSVGASNSPKAVPVTLTVTPPTGGGGSPLTFKLNPEMYSGTPGSVINTTGTITNTGTTTLSLKFYTCCTGNLPSSGYSGQLNANSLAPGQSITTTIWLITIDQQATPGMYTGQQSVTYFDQNDATKVFTATAAFTLIVRSAGMKTITLVIDPGHGQILKNGVLTFQRSPTPRFKLIEDVLTLDISKQVTEILATKGVRVLMTQGKMTELRLRRITARYHVRPTHIREPVGLKSKSRTHSYLFIPTGLLLRPFMELRHSMTGATMADQYNRLPWLKTFLMVYFHWA